MPGDDLVVFALNATRRFGDPVARSLGVPLADHEEREFEDGEHKARPLVNVRGRDVFVVQSLYSDPDASVDGKLCRLLFFLGAVRDAGAGRVTAVIPYLCYARKDRKTKPRDPVTTRYVAALLEAVGVDRILAFEVHNVAAFQNAARCGTDHLEARHLWAEHFRAEISAADVTVVSPDPGGFKRADRLRQSLEAASGRDVPIAMAQKRRSGGVVSGEAVVGDVADRVALVVDDLVAGGTTMARTADALSARGARAVIAAAAHGLFVGDAGEAIAHSSLDRVTVTNSVSPFRLDDRGLAKLEVVDAAPLFAEAIRRIHGGGSLVDLLEG